LICNIYVLEDRIMDFSLGGIIDAAEDVASSAYDLVESAGDLAGEVAPLVSLVNPEIGMGLEAFSEGTDLLEKFVQDQTANQMDDNIRDHRHGCGGEEGGGGGCEGGGGAGGAGGGGSVFEQLALALGNAMDQKLQELLDAANSVSSNAGGADILKQGAKITALSQELGFISQASSTSINGVGDAAKTAAK
jgi:hypothetical protein